MTDLDAVVVEMIRMDIEALAKRTGLGVPQVTKKTRINLNRLFVAAILGQVEIEKLKQWRFL